MAPLNPKPRCLFFDVFGTCVDWRKTVTEALVAAAREALDSPSSQMSSDVRAKASAMTREDWGEVAQVSQVSNQKTPHQPEHHFLGRRNKEQRTRTRKADEPAPPLFPPWENRIAREEQEWRNGYLQFVRSIATDDSNSQPWMTVDEHHLQSIRSILSTHGLRPEPPTTTSLWTDAQTSHLSTIWHRLDPWPDTRAGLRALNAQGYTTCTLSNGNLALLEELVAHGGMEFAHVYSAEMWRSYKPSPKVYQGAAARMGLEPGQCAMVAAHLDDLKAAKAHGIGTAVYVERPGEERWVEMRAEAREWVDVWVEEGEGGFGAVAERLGRVDG